MLRPIARRSPRGRRLALERLENRVVLSSNGVMPAILTAAKLAGGDVQTLTLNASGAGQANGAITRHEFDSFRFVAPVSGVYTFATQTPNSLLDTVAGLYNASNGRLASNDDISSSNTDSRFTYSLTAGTFYSLVVTDFTGSPSGSYTVIVTGPATTPPPPPAPTDDAYEDNDSQAAAFDLGSISSTRTLSNLVMADGHDWYRLTTTAAGGASNFVRLDFTHSQGDLDLELFNAAGTRLLQSAGTTNQEQVSLSGLAAGTYFVHVLGYRGAANPNYTLTIEGTPEAPPPPPPTPTPGGFQIDLAMTGLTTSQRAIARQAADRWAQVITGDLPDVTFRRQTVDDLLIDIRAITIDGVGNTLGQAGWDRIRSGAGGLPYHGVMELDIADVAALEQSGELFATMAHEIGHILGLGTLWDNGLLVGAGTSNPRFVGVNATREYNLIFGRSDTGVPVENRYGAGSRDAHWRESILRTELMTSLIGPGTTMPLSRITIGSMADLGYEVNYAAADNYSPALVSSVSTSLTGSSGSTSLLRGLARGLDLSAASAWASRTVAHLTNARFPNARLANANALAVDAWAGEFGTDALPRRWHLDECLGEGFGASGGVSLAWFA